MALFEYKAIDRSGNSKKGKIEAVSLKQAVNIIKSKGLHPVSVTSSRTKSDSNWKSTKKKKSVKIPYRTITDFTRQLSILVSTGIPYDKAFEVLIEENDSPQFQQILSSIKSQIVEGKSLAQSLEDFPGIFSAMYIAMVKAGEAGGTLDLVLGYLAKSRESNEEITSKIQKALIYPIIMTLIGIGIVVFMITFIIPRIMPLFNQFDIALPLPTRIVIFVSDTVVSNWWIILLIIAGISFISRRALKTKKGRKFFDQLLLRIPILRGIIEKSIVFRFTQMLGTLLKSGVELKQSLGIVKHAIGNSALEDHFDTLTHNITHKGMDLSFALRQAGIFPISVIQMIRVGEESSQLELMLTKVADILDKELKRMLEKSIALIEPLLILWMAGMVGFIVLSVMLPMLKMNQLV